METSARRQSAADRYIREGHPSMGELIPEQGTVFPADPRDLLGDFWPEEESIDEFLAALHEWRGHPHAGPALWRPSLCTRMSSHFSLRTTLEHNRICRCFGTGNCWSPS